MNSTKENWMAVNYKTEIERERVQFAKVFQLWILEAYERYEKINLGAKNSIKKENSKLYGG